MKSMPVFQRENHRLHRHGKLPSRDKSLSLKAKGLLSQMLSLPDLYDCTILISSHMLSEIELMADDIGILNHGQLLFEGSLNDLRRSARQAGMSADNLEDVFLSIVEQDNAARKQRAKL